MSTFTEGFSMKPASSVSLPSLLLVHRPLLSMLSVIVGMATLAIPISGYPTGAPFGACGSMRPAHGFQPPSATPYSISLGAATKYKAGNTLQVTVMGGQFKGLIMQMRQVGTKIVYGEWTNLATDTRTQTCTNSRDTVTHENINIKNNPTFTWTAPDDVTVDLEVVATIAQEKSTWWRNVKSATLTYDVTTTPTPITTPTMPPTLTPITTQVAAPGSASKTTTVSQGASSTGSTPKMKPAGTMPSTVATAIQNTSDVLLVTVLTLFAIRVLV